MEFQTMNCRGDWVDEDNIDRHIDHILDREPIIAPRYNRKPLMNKEDIINYLSNGNEINYDSDWYAKVRMHKEDPKIDWNRVEQERKEFEKKDYLATHDNDWYDNKN